MEDRKQFKGLLGLLDWKQAQSGNAFSYEKALLVAQQTKLFCEEFSIVGLMNVQYAVQGDKVFALEVNPHASRIFPLYQKPPVFHWLSWQPK